MENQTTPVSGGSIIAYIIGVGIGILSMAFAVYLGNKWSK